MDIGKTMHTWQSAVEITSLLPLLNLSGIIVIFFCYIGIYYSSLTPGSPNQRK